MQQEWDAILASTGFSIGFPAWVDQMPELNPVTEHIPLPDELDIMCQLLKFQLDSEASMINNKNKRHAKYLHQQDLTISYASNIQKHTRTITRSYSSSAIRTMFSSTAV